MGTMGARRRASAASTVGGILAGFDQQVFRTLPPAHELVRHARPDDAVAGADGSSIVLVPPDAPISAVEGSSAARPQAPVEARRFFDGSPLGLQVLERVHAILVGVGPVDVRTTRSQVAFRRARGFAWLWRPGRYLPKSDVEVVVSIALGRHDPSPRFKEVVRPASAHWMHHLEVRDIAEIDDEVEAWLTEAAARAT